ncbi:glycoside hydrolase family 18 protein [Dactylosporangium matsuzakiense]|uniref:chitinase n=1 Tax=Dactylosporangium matsuzakiense TaxID=53360 RepID=A0A9W6KP73_9ACTN|nr:glycoside hydrolase family 18 protein [Dactylosporangium matsuzakiense]UWZ46892.1 glycoside hydrolase family 18 protein [Dactylosporangium matsuzakiense]GLL04219.1 chitinase [Dactylosporangium matsuzakiense]
MAARWGLAALLLLLAGLVGCGPDAASQAPGPLLVGYYVPRSGSVPYHVADLERSGAPDRLTHLVYAFGSVSGGRCANGSAADAAEFEALRALKQRRPALKLLWSFGGWNGSSGFGAAAADPVAFASSCRALLDDPRWAGLFDGIDIDWEYPNACGATCDSSGPDALPRLAAALRGALGPDRLVTAAVTADATPGGRLARADYPRAAGSLDWLMAMTYDYAGTADPTGPTAPHSPLPAAEAAISDLTHRGVPPAKLLLGVGFYGRGWTGVTRDTPGAPATAAAPGRRDPGAEDYRVLKSTCPPTGTVAGTAYAHCGTQWWSYDTPATLAGKAEFAHTHHLRGVFCWELAGDTPDGELLGALHTALS